MRRGLLILLGLLVVTWFEFEVYPGHSFLQGETQLLVPMLERLDTPGFLSRDLVAANPTFAYTIYDEITQALHVAARISFEEALLAQQLFFRFAAVFGIFLLARALNVAPTAAVLISGAVNAITHLGAPEAFVTNPEATPAVFALSLIFLAAGMLVQRMPLLAGLAAGLALLYEPVTATAFWLVVITAWICDSSLRKFLRPAWPPLVIFALILGNLVQLQAGLGGQTELTGVMSAAMVQVTRIRTPWVWVSNWVWTALLSYKFLAIAGMWALAYVWTQTERITRWVVTGLIASGFVSLAVALLLLQERAQFAVAMTPARNLAYTVAISAVLCGAASWQTAQRKKWKQSIAWMTLLIASIFNAQVLDLLHLKLDGVKTHKSNSAVKDLAVWANRNTWGSSLFQFPDAENGLEPGVFRALSKRSLWADWQSGVIVDYSEQAGKEWWSRWQATMTMPYSPNRLQEMLRLPIDYYVLERRHQLDGARPVYRNSEYLVYDAQDLREVPRELKGGR